MHVQFLIYSSVLPDNRRRLRGNRFNGTLTIGSDYSTQLQLIDLRDNQISQITVGGSQYNKQLMYVGTEHFALILLMAEYLLSVDSFIPHKSHASNVFFRLVGNPICSSGNNEKYCTPPGQSNQATPPPYSTSKNCSGLPPPCLSDQLLSPSCVCAVPYRGTLFFRSPSFSDLSNGSYWGQLESGIKAKFLSFSLPVDSVALHDPSVNSVNNLQVALEVFPSGKTLFGEQDISDIGFILSNQTYKPPAVFGPYYFIGQQYSFANGKNKIIH